MPLTANGSFRLYITDKNINVDSQIDKIGWVVCVAD